jgi:O-antigen ligase
MLLAPLSQSVQPESIEKDQSRVARYLELFIVGTLSVSMAVIFFNAPRWTRAFGEAGFVALLLWAIYHKRNPVNPIPKYVIIASVLYILSYVVNVFMSPDPTWEHVNIRKYIYIIIGGLLFAFPVKDKYRQFMIIAFFGSAAIAGGFGTYQYLKSGFRALGFSGNPLHYAGLLGFVCCSSTLLLFIKNRGILGKYGFIYLLMVAILSFLGIFYSEARGVWIAVIGALLSTLILYDRKRTLLFVICITLILSSLFMIDSQLKERAISIITSVYTENSGKSSTGTRFELWKGSILIAKSNPLFGVGTGNFERKIDTLVHEKKINEPLVGMHAHNIYFQALATRGVVGLMITLAMFTGMIIWGAEETRKSGNIGGHIIILSTVFTIISGLTENNIEFTKFLAAYCFTVGLFGPLGVMENSENVVVRNDGR